MTKEAKIKCYEVFPTLIHEYEFEPSNREEMIEHVLELDNQGGFKYDRLFEDKEFEELSKFQLTVCETILQQYEYEYDSVEYTHMWPNVLGYGSIFNPHRHRNAILSGTWYLSANPNNNTVLEFYDPRPAANVFEPTKNLNRYNRATEIFPSASNKGLIFPSWMVHWVPQLKTEEQRISIAWNVMVRGQYGQPNSVEQFRIQ